ncbi:MAG TPA: biotin/lipoyl-containing protein [Desulfomonilia bacterium]|nr:biotin/lipoyl-containing protein [Desulfomonilia bacterium]
MNYTLRIAGQDIPIEAGLTGEGIVTANIGGRNVVAGYRVISPNQILLEVDGINVKAYLAEDREGKLINVGGITYLVQDADALARAGTRKRGLKELPQEVTPPMPSVVVRIMVSEGDDVEKGQGVVVVSAMKMETTLQAPFKGKVVQINVAEGDKVMPGQILVDIEREKEADSSSEGGHDNA